MRLKQLILLGVLIAPATEAHAMPLLLLFKTLSQTDPLVPNTFPFTMLSALGFTQADQLLFILCPIFAALGSLVRLSIRALGWASSNEQKAHHSTDRVLVIVLTNVFIAFVAGLVVALYFAGSIVPSGQSVGKLLAFTLLVGFMAPHFFHAQEQRVIRILGKQEQRSGEGQQGTPAERYASASRRLRVS
jgi:hypothetical protein